MKPLASAVQVYWITTPVSGFWIKPLTNRRVLISATEAGYQLQPYVTFKPDWLD